MDESPSQTGTFQARARLLRKTNSARRLLKGQSPD